MLVPLQAITDCFLGDFVCPPGRVTWVPKHTGTGQSSPEAGQDGWQVALHSSYCTWLFAVSVTGHIRDGTELPLFTQLLNCLRV